MKTLLLLVICAILLVLPIPVSAYYTYMPATVVIGQPDFTQGLANQGGTTRANTLSAPRYAIIAEGKLLVLDGGNNRVLIWNRVPTENNMPADVVIGQTGFTGSSSLGCTSNGLNPADSGLLYVNGKLFIADAGRNRVLVFNGIPSTNGAAADYVLGQSSLTSCLSNQGGSPAANTLTAVTGLASDGQRLAIADTTNSRILLFNSIPTTSNTAADVVVGQSTFSGSGTGTTATTMNNPRSVAFYNGKLLVGERGNFRITIFNTIPTTNGAAADVVLGQTDFNSANTSPPSTASSVHPFFIHVDNKGRLYSSDRNSYRYLIWNQIPDQNNAPANIVIGQPDFTTAIQNNGGISAKSSHNAKGIFATDTQMVIADPENNRVLLFTNKLPDLTLSRTVYGQPNGKLRFTGEASTNINHQIIRYIEYSINGSSWTGGAASDGAFDSNREHYFFDFDPSTNSMADQQGYTVKIRATHNNDKDTGNTTLYFEPFESLLPIQNTFTSNRLPSFTFRIHKQRFSDLRENLDHFKILVKKNNGDWIPYIDNIPIAYRDVRNSPDNFQPNNTDNPDGIYEDRLKVVEYDDQNSVITVSPKAVDARGNATDKYFGNGGMLLSDATYQWKIEALDHAGQIQYTESKTLRIGTRKALTTRDFFPLVLTGIGNSNGTIHLSADNPSQTNQPLTYTGRWPTFAGIAISGSTVTFSVKDTTCTSGDEYCLDTYDTIVNNDSTFRKTIPIALKTGVKYEITVSVKDSGDNYNEIQPFFLTITAPDPR